MGYFFGIFILFLLVGTTNAVNITDGLDGLCGGLSVMAFLSYGVICFGSYWIVGYQELAIFSFVLVGALLGFLVFNTHPARVFMGDTGSLALGGFVAGAAYMMQMPLFILLIGLIYLVEVLSVMIQVTYFKATHGKRIFKMAPIHHHFELCGWSETRIVAVFSVITAVMCLIAFLAM